MTSARSVTEMTVKATLAGVVLGVVFGAANAYLVLRVGLTVSASIPAAVMTVAAFRLLRRPSTILEANLSQTIGSASESAARVRARSRIRSSTARRGSEPRRDR